MIALARSNFLNHFTLVISQIKSQGREVFPEICLDINRPDVTNQIYRLYVVDLIERLPNGENQIIECNSDPITIHQEGLPIDEKIAWYGIEFKCNPISFSEEDLILWATRWIRDENPPLGPQDGLTGIIHGITKPTQIGDSITFSVDFGSAPISAFNELIEILEPGLQSLGSYSLINRSAA